jgi:hypothetical protein
MMSWRVGRWVERVLGRRVGGSAERGGKVVG